MLALSLIVNCLIVFPLAFAILRGADQMGPVYGPDSPARQILACLYLSIGLLSLAALLMNAVIAPAAALEIARPLFALQITYKIATLFAVGWQSPVVKTNLAVAVLLTATLVSTGGA